MFEKLMIGILTGVFCVMFTTIVSMVMTPKFMKAIADEVLQQHIAVLHQHNLYSYVKKEIDSHINTCPASVTIDKIEKIAGAVMWLVVQEGGNPHDFGLTGGSSSSVKK